jgi:hypothetical protein
MSGWTIAGLVCIGLAVWISAACIGGVLIGRWLKRRREFDAELTTLAESVGVNPGPSVELDPNYRHSLPDGDAA